MRECQQAHGAVPPVTAEMMQTVHASYAADLAGQRGTGPDHNSTTVSMDTSSNGTATAATATGGQTAHTDTDQPQVTAKCCLRLALSPTA